MDEGAVSMTMDRLRRSGRGLVRFVGSREDEGRDAGGSRRGDLAGRPARFTERHPLAMVYGGGGVFGIAYTAGVAAGLRDGGVQVHRAPALGTSAGSWTAAAMALGVAYDDLAAHSSPRLPTHRPAALADIAREVFGEARHDNVAVTAVHVRSWRRHILDGGRYPLADLVAASSAVPGLLPPYRVDGRAYVDGVVSSATSIDAAAEADHIIVVAPLAAAALGPMGRAAAFLLERELRRWQARHPERAVTAIRPNEAIARVLGMRPPALFDDAIARAVYPLAREQGLSQALPLLRTTVGAEPAA